MMFFNGLLYKSFEIKRPAMMLKMHANKLTAIFADAAQYCSTFNSSTVSYAKAEKVLNPPQNPTVISTFTEGFMSNFSL